MKDPYWHIGDLVLLQRTKVWLSDRSRGIHAGQSSTWEFGVVESCIVYNGKKFPRKLKMLANDEVTVLQKAVRIRGLDAPVLVKTTAHRYDSWFNAGPSNEMKLDHPGLKLIHDTYAEATKVLDEIRQKGK